MRPLDSESGSARLEEQIFRFIACHCLFNGIRRLGLAVSGGSDSFALLHLLPPLCAKTGIVPVVLNFDHGIPGEHSDEDAVFVRDACARLRLEFVGEKGGGICARDGKSLEMVARACRQDFYRRSAARYGLDAIATGHQADDVAETLVLRLLRGAGAAGLSGMKPLSVLPPEHQGGKELRIIRPLLDVTRDELREWLRARGLGWREDPSNTNERIQRNEVRRSILPALARRGNGLAATVRQLVRSADLLREEDGFLDSLAQKWLQDNLPPNQTLPLASLRADLHLALQRRVLRLWLFDVAGANASGYSEVESLLSATDGDALTLPGNVHVVCTAGGLHVVAERAKAVPPETPLPVGGVLTWGQYRISAELCRGPVRARSKMGEWPAVCSLSVKMIGNGVLSVRGRRDGDRIAPFGLHGTKKLQDVFTDAKVPAEERDSYPVIVCNGEIAWLPGYRIAEKFAVREGDTAIRICVERV